MLFLLLVLGAVVAEPSLGQPVFQGKSLRILPLGGSITWGQGSSDGNGYRQDLRNLLSPAEVTYIGTQCSGDMQNGDNEGHPSYRIDQLKAVVASDIASQPNVVLVYAGTNDMLSEQAHAAPGHMQQLVRYLLENVPDVLVVVSKLFTDARPQIAQRIDVFDSELRVTQLGNVMIADMSDLLTTADLGPDGEHPEDAGYAKMAQVFFDVLARAESEGRIADPLPIRYTPICNGLPVSSTTSSLASTSQPATASTARESTSPAARSFTTSDTVLSTSTSLVLPTVSSASQTVLSTSMASETSVTMSTSPTSTSPPTSQSPTNPAQKLTATSNAGIPLVVFLVWLILGS